MSGHLTGTEEILSRDLNVLRRYWGVTGNSFKRLGDGHYLLTGTKETYFFKRHSFLATPNVRYLEALYRSASDRCLVPRMFENKNNTLLAEVGGSFYSLQEYVESDARGKESEIPRRLVALHEAFADAEVEPFANHMGCTVTNLLQMLECLGISEAKDAVSRVQEVLDHTEPVVIHGDLHEGNVLWLNGNPVFVDIDSAHYSHPMMDVAFAAFRILDASAGEAAAFAQAYADTSGRDMPVDLLWHFLVWAVSQRIAFILIEAERGCRMWMPDLANQKKHLMTALQKIQRSEAK